MSVKTTIAPFSLASTGPQCPFWIVANDIDASVIEGFDQGGAKVFLSDNSPLTGWTAPKGIGDWSPYALKNATVYVAFPAVLTSNKKVQNFLHELATYMVAAGAKFYILELPNGTTVAEALHGVTYGNYKDRIKDFIPAFGDEEAGDEEKARVFEGGHAEFLNDIAEREFDFFRSKKDKEYFLMPKEDNIPNLAYMVGEVELRHILTSKFKKETNGNVLGQGPVAAVMDTLAASCAYSKNISEPKFRIASSGDGYYWMDLGTDDGQAIRWSSAGWEVVGRVPKNLGFAFRRSEEIAPLPFPAKVSLEDAGDVLNKYLGKFINVAPAHWPMVVAFLINHMTPNYKRPIMLLTSEAEAGKTTATMAMKFAVEGVIDRGAEIPEKADDSAVTVAAERVTVYNNVSKIDKKMSDFLCQVQGDSKYKKRKLRTDSEQIKLKLVSSVIMNGITTGELHGDLKTRLVRLELKPLVGESMLDAEVDEALQAMHPEILGALLTLAVEVQRRMPNIPHPGKGYRMLEFTKILMALSDIWDLGAGPMREYKRVMDSLSAEGLDDPLFEVLRKESLKMSNRVSADEYAWEVELGSKDLMGAYNSFSISRAISGSTVPVAIDKAQQLTELFRRGITDWKRHGFSYESLGQKTHNGQRQTVYRIRFEGAEWLDLVDAH